MAEARRARAAEQPAPGPAEPVSLDGAWAATGMARRRGRAPRGGRAPDAVPHGRRRTAAATAAPRADGIVAPLAPGGATDGPRFPAYVRQLLAPALRPGDVVVMDGLSSHEAAGAREAVGAAGAAPRHPPSCSPGRNPVEQASAKPEASPRAAAARATEAPRAAIGGLLASASPAERARYFAHRGCRQSG